MGMDIRIEMRESVFKAEHCHEGICINMGLIYLSQVDYGIRGYDSELFTKVTLRVSKYVDSSVILQYIQTFYKDTITTQFITNQATLTASAITVHSTKNLVDNLFQSIPANHTCQYHIYKTGKACKTYLGGAGM